jgi:uncharacterized integral membrane protein
MVQESTSIPRDNASSPISTGVKEQFKGTAHWALIIATIALTLLVVVMAGAVGNAFKMSIIRGGFGLTPVLVALAYLLVSLLLWFPVWTLLQFGLRMKRAVKQEDLTAIDFAFSHMKSRLIYSGLGLLGMIALGGGLGFWLS